MATFIDICYFCGEGELCMGKCLQCDNECLICHNPISQGFLCGMCDTLDSESEPLEYPVLGEEREPEPSLPVGRQLRTRKPVDYKVLSRHGKIKK